VANRERGEVTVEVEGKVYRLQLSINGCCEIEDLLSSGGRRVSFNTWLREAFAPGTEPALRDLRLAVWGALREHHTDLTIGDAGWLMDRVGWHVSYLHVAALLDSTQPDPADLKALGIEAPPPDPREARRPGTGGRSRSRPAKSESPATPSGASRSDRLSVNS